MKNSWRLSASVVPASQTYSSEPEKNTLCLFTEWKQLQWQLIFGNSSPYQLGDSRSSLNHILKLINKPTKLHHSKYRCQFHQQEQISNFYIACSQQFWRNFIAWLAGLSISDPHMDLSPHLFQFIAKVIWTVCIRPRH